MRTIRRRRIWIRRKLSDGVLSNEPRASSYEQTGRLDLATSVAGWCAPSRSVWKISPATKAATDYAAVTARLESCLFKTKSAARCCIRRQARWGAGFKAKSWFWGFPMAVMVFAVTLKIKLFSCYWQRASACCGRLPWFLKRSRPRRNAAWLGHAAEHYSEPVVFVPDGAPSRCPSSRSVRAGPGWTVST